MAGRILVIRGGAIGDFILTLPAIGLLRENFPEAHLEILGYRHIASLAEGRFYADSVRSIEYAPLARFFNPKSELDPELTRYFASFHQVISYIFDPDELFASSLRKAGVKNLITISPKITDAAHAACQLAAPLESMALWLDDPAARFHPSTEDRRQADELLRNHGDSVIALHPGSGSERKNWPLSHWEDLIARLLQRDDIGTLAVIAGESDETRLRQLGDQIPEHRRLTLHNLPLPVLGAVLQRSRAYVGHDTGISHLAAAAGAPCVLLFGPTDPEIWAPQNAGVRVLAAPEGELSALDPSLVADKLGEILADAR